ncbi:MAG: signal peptidase II [Candidatus Hydrothermales bacterium]
MSKRDRGKDLIVILGRILFAFFIALLAFISDQITKNLALKYLEYGVPLEILGPYFRFTLVFNPYGVWGLPITKILPYEILAFFAIFILILFIAKEENLLYNLFYGLILGGALGNLYDRIKMKAVVDFIEIGISENLHWPIFNLADTFITLGIIGILIFTFIKKDK